MENRSRKTTTDSASSTTNYNFGYLKSSVLIGNKELCMQQCSCQRSKVFSLIFKFESTCSTPVAFPILGFIFNQCTSDKAPRPTLVPYLEGPSTNNGNAHADHWSVSDNAVPHFLDYEGRKLKKKPRVDQIVVKVTTFCVTNQFLCLKFLLYSSYAIFL